jgi:hypothetical protein
MADQFRLTKTGRSLAIWPASVKVAASGAGRARYAATRCYGKHLQHATVCFPARTTQCLVERSQCAMQPSAKLGVASTAAGEFAGPLIC